MSSLQDRVGAEVKRRRLQFKLTQQELADGAGVDRSYLLRIERGRANPTLEVLYRIADMVQCHVTDFLP